MPPRLSLAQAAQCCRAAVRPQRSCQPSLVSLFAALSIQSRNAHILASLSNNRDAYHKRIRKGRGPSAGKGKTSGRGHKGQKQHGKVKPWFQGGQTPLIVSKGRKGFENHNAPEMSIVNLDRIQAWIDAGRLDPSKPITPKELISSGCAGRQIKDGIKLCARSLGAKDAAPLTGPINIMVSRASASAIAAIEAAGGRIVTRYYTREAIRRLLAGTSVNATAPLPVGKEHVEGVLAQAHSRKHKYRLPDPTSRWDIEYYRDPAHRGYLSHMLQPGESPSLYFKVPSQRKVVYASKTKKDGAEEDARLF